MNREILFRAKINKELSFIEKGAEDIDWVYGWYAEGDSDGLAYILPKNNSLVRSKVVFRDTVGQYTGLEDKNGVKIFDGDILNTAKNLGRGMTIVTFRNGMFKAYGASLETWIHSECKCEVIGNIYDNPELLNQEE